MPQRRLGRTTHRAHALSAEHGRDERIHERVEVVVEATGDALAGIVHAIQVIEVGKHIVMVNVEADALAGAWLGRKRQPPA